MNVNFQIMKRLLCCLLAVLVLFCAFVRPIEASAAAAAAGALICAITPEIAVSAAITALGITFLTQTDYESLVTSISATIPGRFLIDTIEKGKQVSGVVYDKKCYLSKDFVSWVSDKLWTGATTTTTPAAPAVSHSYGFTGTTAGVYQSCVSWLNSAYPGAINKCTVFSNCFVTRVKDDDGNVYNVCAFSNGTVEFSIDSNGYFCESHNSDCKIIYTSSVKSQYITGYGAASGKLFSCASATASTKQGNGTLVFGNGLRANGSIASSLDDEIYAGWTGRSITISDSQTIYLPVSVSETVAGTGSLTQDVAQAGTTYVPGAVEETDEELPIVDVPVVGADLLGIVTLLKSILQVLLNIYRVVSSNISSWWDNATTTIALNIASLGTSIETWWNTATETIVGGITDAVTSITGAISKAIADVIEWLKSMGATLADILEWIKSLPSAIVDGIASVLTKIFVPTEDFVTVKLEAIRAKFPFVDSIITTGQALGGAFGSFYTEPPIIYAELHNATGSYYYGDRAVILDLRWYSQYKPTVDILISAFLWAVFCWRMFLKIPGIISGMPGDFVMDAASSAGVLNDLPTRSAGYEIQRQSNRDFIRRLRKK